MPRFRIHRIKDTPGENFRWAAHTGGLAIIKPKDYNAHEEIEAPTPYSAWKLMAERGQPLRPGDVLETLPGDAASGDLQISKYIGFEPAQWHVPEPKPDNTAAIAESNPESIPHTT
jgi:hypothetical protein